LFEINSTLAPIQIQKQLSPANKLVLSHYRLAAPFDGEWKIYFENCTTTVLINRGFFLLTTSGNSNCQSPGYSFGTTDILTPGIANFVAYSGTETFLRGNVTYTVGDYLTLNEAIFTPSYQNKRRITRYRILSTSTFSDLISSLNTYVNSLGLTTDMFDVVDLTASSKRTASEADIVIQDNFTSTESQNLILDTNVAYTFGFSFDTSSTSSTTSQAASGTTTTSVTSTTTQTASGTSTQTASGTSTTTQTAPSASITSPIASGTSSKSPIGTLQKQHNTIIIATVCSIGGAAIAIGGGIVVYFKAFHDSSSRLNK